MSLEYAVVEACTLGFQNPLHTGDITVTHVPGGTKADAGGSNITVGGIVIVANGSNGAGITAGTGTLIWLVDDASRVEVEVWENFAARTSPVMYESWTQDMTITGVDGDGDPASYTTTIVVADPGQDVVQVEVP